MNKMINVHVKKNPWRIGDIKNNKPPRLKKNPSRIGDIKIIQNHRTLCKHFIAEPDSANKLEIKPSHNLENLQKTKDHTSLHVDEANRQDS